MLASAETIKIVADALKRHSISTSVVDPVRPGYPIHLDY